MFEQWLGVPRSFTKHILILYIEDCSLKWLCLPLAAERREEETGRVWVIGVHNECLSLSVLMRFV